MRMFTYFGGVSSFITSVSESTVKVQGSDLWRNKSLQRPGLDRLSMATDEAVHRHKR